MDVSTMKETVDHIENRIRQKIFTQHVVVNVAKLVNMRKDTVLRDSVETCDIINIDGMGVVLGARFLGHQIPERVAGVDPFHQLLAMCNKNDFSVFLLGATDDVVAKTSEVAQHH